MAALSTASRKHIEAICAAWQKGVASIIATGVQIAKAQIDIGEGKFEAEVLPELPFSRSTAYRLMAIASHKVLSDVAHVRHLPPSWGTLDALTKVPQTKLIAAIKRGDVHPGMERKDVAELLPARRSSAKKKSKAADDPVETKLDDEANEFIRSVRTFVFDEFGPDLTKWMGKHSAAVDDELRTGIEDMIEQCSMELHNLVLKLFR
jgi:hypothetical protein